LKEEADIDYVHRPELGVPKERRENLNTPEDYAELFKWYDENVIKKNRLFDTIMKLKEYYPANYVFMCKESDRSKCHRSRIAAWFEKDKIRCEDLKPSEHLLYYK
jgi:uncharacterized protein (DUF488 family)